MAAAHKVHNFKDLTGQRIDRLKLVVVCQAGSNASGHVLWRCLMDNGKEVLRTGNYLSSYEPQQKVLHPKLPPAPKKKPTPEYSAWTSMKQRCLNSRTVGYSAYGGRGILIYQAWQDSYETFLEAVGPRPGKGYSLERKENDGHYEPGNVIWATCKAQGRNTRSNRWITYNGETLTVAGWAERTGLPVYTIHNRLKMKWPVERLFQSSIRKPHVRLEGYTDPEKTAWKNMIQRCTYSKHPAWKDYGGRGITVCDRWRNDFKAFLADMGDRPSPKHSLERKRVNEGYSSDNCVWAVRKVQARNTRRARMLTHRGETLCLAEWAERLGVKSETIRSRLRMGWSEERALTF